MLTNESNWIGKALSQFAPGQLSPLVNLGSSTEEFRTLIQPHIEQKILAPLRSRNIRVVHSDLSAGNGIDVCGDIYTDEVLQKLKATEPRSVLCSNMFEHVTDRSRLASVLTELLPSGGILVVTVPFSFPWHPDPLDTYFRPTPQEIHALLPEFNLVRGDIVACGSLTGRYLDSRRFMFSQIIGSLIPFPSGRWFRNLHHWCWLFRQYKVSCAVLVKK